MKEVKDKQRIREERAKRAREKVHIVYKLRHEKARFSVFTHGENKEADQLCSYCTAPLFSLHR